MTEPSPITVVLVDDQELFRGGISVIVDAQPDMTVVGTAGDGASGVEVIRSTRPDIVLMDIEMPTMNGVDATRNVLQSDGEGSRSRSSSHSDHDSPGTQIIVLTTFDFDERAALAIEAGASGFLLKDTTPSRLVDAIRTVHAGNAVIAPDDLRTLLGGHFTSETQVPDAFSTLTPKEIDVFDKVASGMSNAELSEALFMSESTVKSHVSTILRKLGLRDRVQLVVFAYEHGLK